MRITMTSPILARQRRFDRVWDPAARLSRLLGAELAHECVLGILPEINGIGSARPRRGGDLAVARSSDTRWLSNGDGMVRRLAPDGWRAEAGIYAPGTNLCLQSEGLGTSPWTVQNGVTVTLDGGVAGPLAKVFRLDDPGSSSLGAVYQQLTGLADGQPYAFTVYIKPGTSSGFTVGLRDTTALAWRAQVNFAVSGTRVTWLSTVAGTYVLEPVPQSNWYRVTVRAASVVGANTHRVLVYPTLLGVTEAGNLYATGAQLQQGILARPYIPTTTATQSRSAEQVSIGTAGLATAFTLGLVTQVDDHAASPCILYLPGTAGNNNRLDLFLSPSTGLNVTLYDNTGAMRTWVQNTAPVDGESSRWVIANDNAGTVRAWKNGVAVALTASGAGTGVRDALNATLQLGNKDQTRYLQGQLRALLVFNRAVDPGQSGRVDAALQRIGS